MKRRAALLFLAVLTAGLVLGTAASTSQAQIPPGCSELCGTSCVKPIALPDRWDDVTTIPGHDGTIKGLPDWRNNAKYDQEAFTDVNANGAWDPGEPYLDSNRNGQFDREAYDPISTGYVADPAPANTLAPAGDLGQALWVWFNNGNATPVPGNYQAIDFPALNKGVPVGGSEAFTASLMGCNPSLVEPGDLLQTETGLMSGPANQGLRALVDEDPGAYWDPITRSVQGSAFPLSPRVLFVVAYDPRIYPNPGSASLVARKILPIFIEQMSGTAAFQGRLLRVATTGTSCVAASAGEWLYACATPAAPATWGRVKATYR